MFDNQRYITKRISEEIPLNLVLFMWSRIDVLKATTAGKLDYLQVFELKEINEFAVLENQLVIHRSEDPSILRATPSPLGNQLLPRYMLSIQVLTAP